MHDPAQPRTAVRLVQRAAATILPRKGALATLSDALTQTGHAMPAVGRWTETGGTMLVRTAPHQLLALAGDHSLPDRLISVVAGTADIVDTSDAFVAVEIAGPGAHGLLARIVPLDLDALTPGSAARTISGHVQVLLLCRDARPGYELLCSRSYAASMQHMLHAHDPAE